MTSRSSSTARCKLHCDSEVDLEQVLLRLVVRLQRSLERTRRRELPDEGLAHDVQRRALLHGARSAFDVHVPQVQRAANGEVGGMAGVVALHRQHWNARKRALHVVCRRIHILLTVSRGGDREVRALRWRRASGGNRGIGYDGQCNCYTEEVAGWREREPTLTG